MKTYLGNVGTAPPINLVLDGGEWPAPRPGRLTPGTHWTGGQAGSACSAPFHFSNMNGC